MARPNLDYEPQVINIKLCLHPEYDSDLLAWFESLPARGRATAVIMALRSGGVAVANNALAAEDALLAADLDDLFF